MRSFLHILFGLLLAILPPATAAGTPGDLDPSFGEGGFVLTDLTPSSAGRWHSIAVQADGRIVAAGYSVDGHNEDFVVARYNADGSLDASFNESGFVTTDLGGAEERGHAVAIQPDGKIVVVGYTWAGANEDFAIVRYDEYGSPDYTFGDNGRVITAVGTSSDRAESVAIQPDGKIVVGGYSKNNLGVTDFAIVRYNSDGSLDSTFDGDGKTVTSVGVGDSLTSVALQPDGKIVVAGNSSSAEIWSGVLIRYNANGTLDTSFAGDGTLTLSFAAGRIDAAAAAIQGGGRIVVAGSVTYSTGGRDVVVLRYNSDGSPDATFDNDGVVTTSVGDWDSDAVSVSIQDDGRIVVAGRAITIGYSTDFAVVRYNADGSLDQSFDGDGRVTTDFGGSSDLAEAAALQSDGRILVAGVANYGQFTVVCYETDGNLDTSFDGDGIVTTAVVTAADSANDLAIQADGKIVVVGATGTIHGYDAGFIVARYNRDGSFDTGFGSRGIARIYLDTPTAAASSVVMQSDFSIVVAGYGLIDSGNNVTGDFVIARLDANGSLDTTFGIEGVVTTDFGGTHDHPTRIALQSDGKIVAVGAAYNDDNGGDVIIARYHVDGSLDDGFGDDGVVQADMGSRHDNASSVAIQADGKIVTTIRSNASDIEDFVVARYNPDGTPDSSFGVSGVVRTDFASSIDQARALALQEDGKIVVVGTYDEGENFLPHFALARYNLDGTLDATFGENGRTTSIAGGYSAWSEAVAVQNDGKIVAVGSVDNTESGGGDDFVLIRYHPDGSVDEGFGASGRVWTDFRADSDFAHAVALQDDGKIVVAGTSFDAISSDFVISRYIATDCGNGIVDDNGLEECDDAGETAFCDSNCTLANCGDGDINPAASEECDDDNDIPGDGCDDGCKIEFCGDGIVNNSEDSLPTEECDDPSGNGTNPDQCRPDCQQAACLDGILDTGEVCDEAAETTTCDDDCTLVACGDGNRNQAAHEECDDGNAVNGDGCSDLCEIQQLCGDANDDGRHTASDAVLILKAAIGIDVVCPTWICDVDGQSGPKATDALTVLNLSVGLPASAQCGDISSLVLRLVDPVIVAGLNATIDLSDVAGSLVGAGSNVECESLISGVTAIFNRPSAATLRIGYVSLDGIEGPLSVARCEFTAIRRVRSADFQITVEDAVDLSDAQIFPRPQLDAIPY